MIVTLNTGAPGATADAILAAAAAAGCEARTMDDGHGGTVIGVAGTIPLDGLLGIGSVLEKHRPYMLASRECRPMPHRWSWPAASASAAGDRS